MKKVLLTVSLLCFTVISYSFTLELNNNEVFGRGDFEIEEMKVISSAKGNAIQISVAECKPSGAIGKAELPVYSQFLYLPPLGNYRVTAFSYEQEEIQLSHPLVEWEREENFEADTNWQKENKWFPEEKYTIGNPTIMRGIRFSQLSLYPVQYNPALQKIRVVKNIQLELKIDKTIQGNELLENKARITKAFSELAEAQILGYEADRIITDSSYLIISPDSCEDEIVDLVHWKRKLGYSTTYVKLSQIGSSNDDIKNFLQSAYDSWENPPEFVILVGDVTGPYTMPSNYVDAYLPYGAQNVTDHTYTLLEGDDYFPDIFIGRLSIQGITELKTIINKIIHYQSNPYTQFNWFSKALMVTCINSYWGGYTSARETKMAVRDKLFDYTYTVVDTFFSPYQSNINTMQNMINQGYSFINYRGFGGPNYWWEPYFTTNDIYGLNNGYLLPMVTSMTCGGGDFAAEEDVSCFGETWLKAGTPTNFKGAIGFIGPSERDTKTPFNNSNDMGIYQGITQENLLRCGQMLLRGKMELYQNYPNFLDWGDATNSVMFYFYVYNLLGDPGLRVWTKMPEEITFTMSENITTSSNFIEVQITDIVLGKENFVAAITNEDNELLYRAETDETGLAMIPIDMIAGDYEITISKEGYIPKNDSFEVIQQNQIQILSYETDEEPICGNAVELIIFCKNQSEDAYSAIEFTLSNSDSTITIVEDNYAIESINPLEEFSVSFLFEISSIWLEGNELDFILSIDSEEIEQMLHLPISTFAPEFALENMTIDNDVIEPGMQNSIQVTLLNTGSVESGAATIELKSCNENFAQVTQPVLELETVLAGESIELIEPFTIQVSENVMSGENVFFEMLVKQNDENVFVLPFSLIAGVVEITSPTFSEYGYKAIECRDEGNLPQVSFNWIELDPEYGGSGTLLTPNHTTADGYSSQVELPFDFVYYGKSYSTMSVCSEGYISMGESDLVFHRNRNIPSGSGPKAMIAPFWDDMYQGELFFQYIPEQNLCIIQWSRMRSVYYSSYYETFQVILYDSQHYSTATGDGDIKFQYMEVNNVDSGDNYATVGIENESKTSGLLLTFANLYPETVHPLQNETAILFTTNSESNVQSDDDVLSPILYLGQNYPNPFNPTTTISFSVEKEQEVELTIFNVKGQKIKTLLRENRQTGTHHIQWDGTNEKKQAVSSGIYLYQLKTESQTLSKRMLLLK